MTTRPTKLYMADTAVSSPQSPVETSGATRVPLERAPHSIDLDITLEDKDKVCPCPFICIRINKQNSNSIDLSPI